MWEESENRTPLICFLSMGSDPTDNIERLAKSKNISRLYLRSVRHLPIIKYNINNFNEAA